MRGKKKKQQRGVPSFKKRKRKGPKGKNCRKEKVGKMSQGIGNLNSPQKKRNEGPFLRGEAPLRRVPKKRGRQKGDRFGANFFAQQIKKEEKPTLVETVRPIFRKKLRLLEGSGGEQTAGVDKKVRKGESVQNGLH